MDVGALTELRGRKSLREKDTQKSQYLIYGGRGVKGKSVLAGIVSFIIPGAGQLINENKPAKALVHFVFGLPAFLGAKTPILNVFWVWHVWSGWDGLIDRPGGYMDGHLKAPPAEGIYDAGLGRISANC